MVAFNEITLSYNAVARFLLNKQDGDAYAAAISKVLGHVTKSTLPLKMVITFPR